MKRLLMITCLTAVLNGCSTMGNALNPFYETPAPVALLGDKNDHALNGNRDKEDLARKALEAMSSYQRASYPSPYKPVMQPSVVRLMWIPDHINRHGDLVPGHYYYLKVLDDRWAVSDAFELESQLKGPNTGGSDLPFVLPEDKVK